MKLQINNVTKCFKEKTAVSQFSMEIETGQCVGLIGPNGAGKSTLINIIADIIEADVGNVLLNGEKISKVKRKMGYLPQYPSFFLWMSAKEMLLFMGQLSGMSKKEVVEEIPAVLAKVGLAGEEHAKIRTFSGGMKQRLGIAQALIHKPAFILMDEPVSALDPIGRREVLDLIQDIKKDTTILLSTHILGDAQELCDRFVIMKNGLKIADTTMAELISRHHEPAFHVEITGKDRQWVQLAGHLPFVKSVEQLGNHVKITVDHLEKRKNTVLKHAIDHEVDIIRFEMGGSESLEDLFMKMVISA